jgi:hypothetical protein
MGNLVTGQPGNLAQPTQLTGKPTPTDRRTGGIRHPSTSGIADVDSHNDVAVIHAL